MNENSNRLSDRGQPQSRRRGAVLLEFALAWTTFLLIVVVGIMDFGRAIWTYNALAHATYEGVRYATVRGSDSSAPATASTIQEFVRSRVVVLAASSVQVSVEWAPDNKPGSTVRIQAQHAFEPILGMFLPDVPLASTAEMVIVQ